MDSINLGEGEIYKIILQRINFVTLMDWVGHLKEKPIVFLVYCEHSTHGTMHGFIAYQWHYASMPWGLGALGMVKGG